MKKLICGIGILAIIVSTTFAVDFSIGARGNFNIAAGTTIEEITKFNDAVKKKGITSDLKAQPNLGGGFGVYANFGLLPLGPVVLGLQPEFNMSFKNGAYVEESLPILGKQSAKLSGNSIELPLLLTLNLALGDNMKIGINAGPYASFPINVKVSTTGSVLQEKTYDVKTTNMTWGFIAGANFGIKAGKGHVIFDARYMFDFSPVKGEQLNVGVYTFENLYTRRGLNLGIGYEFNF